VRLATLKGPVAGAGLLALVALATRCRAAERPALEHLRVRVLASYPHDPGAYTQGLLWHQGALYESTGQYGHSRLRRVDLGSGEILAERALPDEVFGEGLARVEDRLVQLSWKAGRAWSYDLAGFALLGEWSYSGEGWGLCFDGARLWMSDGSDRLLQRDPITFDPLSELRVTLEGRPAALLNELECAEGWIYANVYQSDWILRIDPSTGEVRGLIDASGLLVASEREGVDVLNGIAYNPDKEVFYLTGKYWPRLFEVSFESFSGEYGLDLEHAGPGRS
jgi:glutaminyl-peptide cyclotransferase